MKKYIFSEKVGKKVTKYEIIAETLEEAQKQLTAKLEVERDTPLLSVGLPDYIEPIDPPANVTLKTFNITFRPDPDNYDETETITYKALSLNSAEGQFLEDYPDQAGQYRETHMPLSNYAVDRENAKNKTSVATESEKLQEELEPIDMTTPKEGRMTSTDNSELGFFDKIFGQAKSWAKLFTSFFVSLIGLGIVSSILFGIDGGFGVVDNISTLLTNFNGLTGLIVLFLIYFLFIRSGQEDKT
jgi:hypothetical protein